MSVNKQGFISALKLRTSGDKGWFVAPSCSYCSARDRMGVLLEGYGSVQPHFHCFKCGKAGGLHILAKRIGKPDLISGEYEAPMDIEMNLETFIDIHTPECNPPVGFRRTMNHEYLMNRNITALQFNMFKFGYTNIHPKIAKDYIIILIEENGKCVGYVARSIKSKDWIDKYNETSEVEYLRYRNSDTDFSKLVLGIDEITAETKTVIAVEGAFDKLAVDRKLGLYDNPTIKCVCTFGTKISECQAVKISAKGAENLIILYDSGTVNKSKKVSRTSSSFFSSVSVGSLTNGDPDECSPEEIAIAVSGAINQVEYSITNLEDIEL